MNNDLISRSALKKKMNAKCRVCDARFDTRMCGNCGMDWARDLIAEIPAVEAESVKQANWNKKGYCTNCGNRCIGNDYEEWRTKYCPYCGAKMKGTATLD